MLAATIAAGTVRAPVRIRNLSEVGAMIDGSALPDVGCTLMLNRLELTVAATVIWNHAGRCGLSLKAPITVDAWIAGVRASAASGSLGQLRVDHIQSAIRSGAALPSETRPPTPDLADAEPLEPRIAAELARVKRTLDEISEELTDDIDVLMRHQRAMQNLDVAAAIIQSLAAVVAADDRASAVAAVDMHDLRSRLSGQPTLT
jgi:hypothetical protein